MGVAHAGRAVAHEWHASDEGFNATNEVPSSGPNRNPSSGCKLPIQGRDFTVISDIRGPFIGTSTIHAPHRAEIPSSIYKSSSGMAYALYSFTTLSACHTCDRADAQSANALLKVSGRAASQAASQKAAKFINYAQGSTAAHPNIC